MKRKQRVARTAAIAVFLLSVLFPPWSYVITGWSSQCFAGYRFVLTPPPLKSPDEFRQIFFPVYDSPGGSDVVVRIEYIRLVLEGLTILFFSAGLIALLGDGFSALGMFAGAMSILIGIALIVLLLLIPNCHAR